jgi:hypothetical protein
MTILYLIAHLTACNTWYAREHEVRGKDEAECDQMIQDTCQFFPKPPFVLHMCVIKRTVLDKGIMAS